MMDLLSVMVDHPRSVVDRCCYVLKFRISYRDSAIYILSHFGLKLQPIRAALRGFGAYFSEMRSSIVLTPKSNYLRGMSFEPQNVKIGPTVRPMRVIEKNRRGQSEKSHKGAKRGTLTPSTPAVPNCCCSKGPAPYWSNPHFLIFDIRSLWRSVLGARAAECQKLKIVG